MLDERALDYLLADFALDGRDSGHRPQVYAEALAAVRCPDGVTHALG